MTHSRATIDITPEEFHLLSQYISPLRFNESLGESVWVHANGKRQRVWTASCGETTSVVTIDDGSVAPGETWCFPIPEALLVNAGRFIMFGESITFVLDHETAELRCDKASIKVSQNPKALCPVVPVSYGRVPSARVDGGGLWAVLGMVGDEPTGVDANQPSPPAICDFDPARGEIRISVDWTAQDAGVHVCTLKATFFGVDPDDPPSFALPYPELRSVLRHPASFRSFDITLWAPSNGVVAISGDGFSVTTAALPKVAPWGHDLAEVVGDFQYEWQGCNLVLITNEEMGADAMWLSAIPEDERVGDKCYRVVADVLGDVLPSEELAQELAELQDPDATCRLVLRGDNILAVADLTEQNYKHLPVHLERIDDEVLNYTAKVVNLPSAITGG